MITTFAEITATKLTYFRDHVYAVSRSHVVRIATASVMLDESWQALPSSSGQTLTVFAKGNVWGFMHLTFQQDRVVVNVVTTANDGSGSKAVEFAQSFARRTAAQ